MEQAVGSGHSVYDGDFNVTVRRFPLGGVASACVEWDPSCRDSSRSPPQLVSVESRAWYGVGCRCRACAPRWPTYRCSMKTLTAVDILCAGMSLWA